MLTAQLDLRESLKRLGFARKNKIKFYGLEFELVGDPIVQSDSVVFVDAVERKSGQIRRIRIPLNIVKMAAQQTEASQVA